MIIVVNETYLDVDKVNSILMGYEENKTIHSNVVWWNPFTWNSLPEVRTDPKYVLKMEYSRGPLMYTYTSTNPDYRYLKDKFRRIVEQLKMQSDAQNQEMLDKLFEEALKGDSK